MWQRFCAITQLHDRPWTKALVLLLVVSLLVPLPAEGQFLDIGVIITALGTINSTLTNVIGGALRTMNGILGAVRDFIGQIRELFQNTVYPQAAIDRARALVGQVMGIYRQIQAVMRLPVAAATLANPQRLEQRMLSRDPSAIPALGADYTRVYQPLPPAVEAPPELRDLIDMTDAAAQAALKRAVAIDAIAEQELQAAERLHAELQTAAPGTAPMIEAQATAWLVRAHAYTQAALADTMRLRAIDLAGAGAELKMNAATGMRTRGRTGTAVQVR